MGNDPVVDGLDGVTLEIAKPPCGCVVVAGGGEEGEVLGKLCWVGARRRFAGVKGIGETLALQAAL